MKKLLAVCIPTYRRPHTLRRCIESVVSQVEEYALADRVEVYVADDASSDDTAEVLQSFAARDCFKGITRERNLGMNVNIKTMLEELAARSEHQLILTDDDYLQPEALAAIIEFLENPPQDAASFSAIWTPRYSYTEDGGLHRIVCAPFGHSRFVKPSAINAGLYMRNGFVLSGLILRAESIDFDFWDRYSENGYFPVIFFGDLLFRIGAYYWHENLVHHTVLNECHWERWGKNDVVIRMRLFTDFINAYGIMAKRIDRRGARILFYIVSLQAIWGAVKSLFANNSWHSNRSLLLDAVKEFKTHRVAAFATQLRLMTMLVLTVFLLTSAIKLGLRFVIMLFTGNENKKSRYRSTNEKFWNWLKSTPAILRLILT